MQATAGEDEAAGVWQNYQTALVARHMGHWIPDLCSEIEAKSTQDYYREFARWIRGFLAGLVESSGGCDPIQIKQAEAERGAGEGAGPSSTGRTPRSDCQTNQARA